MSTNHHVADILAQFLPAYKAQYSLTHQQQRVCQHLLECRSGRLGSQQWQCTSCEHQQVVHCSCRDRHCPRCQGHKTQQWVSQQQAYVLPVRYFHLVFTLPHELNVLSQYAAVPLYSALFRAVWQTLSQFAANRKKAQGQLGMTAELHTGGQSLSQHIHLHCLVPGGVLAAGGKWCAQTGRYLYPVKALSTVFRAKMLAELRAEQVQVTQADKLMAKPWCVYSKPCMTKPETVIEYLSRYTHKGMLHESRLVTVDTDTVVFKYKDYRQPTQHKLMQLSGVEFIRRYLLHVLPKGFMRVRHFGYLANRCRQKKLALIKRQCVCERPPKIERVEEAAQPSWRCPKCRIGELLLRAITISGVIDVKGREAMSTG